MKKFRLIFKSLLKVNLLSLSIVALVLYARRLVIAPNFSMVGTYSFHAPSFLLFMIPIMVFDLFFGGLYRGFHVTYLGFLSYFLLALGGGFFVNGILRSRKSAQFPDEA